MIPPCGVANTLGSDTAASSDGSFCGLMRGLCACLSPPPIAPHARVDCAATRFRHGAARRLPVRLKLNPFNICPRSRPGPDPVYLRTPPTTSPVPTGTVGFGSRSLQLSAKPWQGNSGANGQPSRQVPTAPIKSVIQAFGQTKPQPQQPAESGKRASIDFSAVAGCASRQKAEGHSLTRENATVALVAQGIEQRFPKPRVAGSSPAEGA